MPPSITKLYTSLEYAFDKHGLGVGPDLRHSDACAFLLVLFVYGRRHLGSLVGRQILRQHYQQYHSHWKHAEHKVESKLETP